VAVEELQLAVTHCPASKEILPLSLALKKTKYKIQSMVSTECALLLHHQKVGKFLVKPS
jgi:hypothetical protein